MKATVAVSCSTARAAILIVEGGTARHVVAAGVFWPINRSKLPWALFREFRDLQLANIFSLAYADDFHPELQSVRAFSFTDSAHWSKTSSGDKPH